MNPVLFLCGPAKTQDEPTTHQASHVSLDKRSRYPSRDSNASSTLGCTTMEFGSILRLPEWEAMGSAMA